MHIFLSFILLAASAKLAASIYRGTSLSWYNSFLYACIVGVLNIAVSNIIYKLGYPLSGPIWLIISFAINILLGIWFFGARAIDTQDLPLGWRRGMELSGIMSILQAASISVFFWFLGSLTGHG